MKIIFQFDNGTSRIILSPENVRDERDLELSREGRPIANVVTSKDKSLAVEFNAVKRETEVVDTELRRVVNKM